MKRWAPLEEEKGADAPKEFGCFPQPLASSNGRALRTCVGLTSCRDWVRAGTRPVAQVERYLATHSARNLRPVSGSGGLRVLHIWLE